MIYTGSFEQRPPPREGVVLQCVDCDCEGVTLRQSERVTQNPRERGRKRERREQGSRKRRSNARVGGVKRTCCAKARIAAMRQRSAAACRFRDASEPACTPIRLNFDIRRNTGRL